MSIARRDAKCRSEPSNCAGQTRPPEHRAMASPSERSTCEPQTGHDVGQFDHSRIGWTLLGDHAHHFGNDVAGATHDDRIADPDVLAQHLVHVVQRDVADRDAADEDRHDVRHRRQRARAAYVEAHVVDRTSFLPGQGTCARWPSAARARRIRGRAASRADRPCRRHHRCRTATCRARHRCARNTRGSLRPLRRPRSPDRCAGRTRAMRRAPRCGAPEASSLRSLRHRKKTGRANGRR